MEEQENLEIDIGDLRHAYEKMQEVLNDLKDVDGLDEEYEQLNKIAETIRTTDIKVKEYAEVNQRIKAFRMIFPTGIINTELVSNENGICIFRAVVGYRDEMGNNFVIASGTAYEKENSTFINKTSYIENCETSAVGRALGMAGFGIDTSVASAEEVANAMTQQDANKVIDKKMIDSLNKAIENAQIKDEVVELILGQYANASTSEIKIKDYMIIVNDFKSKK